MDQHRNADCKKKKKEKGHEYTKDWETLLDTMWPSKVVYLTDLFGNFLLFYFWLLSQVNVILVSELG